jgi:DNA mismatch repair protein MLH1
MTLRRFFSYVCGFLRIAAGEVVSKPAACLKELLENSIGNVDVSSNFISGISYFVFIDAGSTVISITVKQGGIQYLQIQDNGHGIKKEDLPLVCERFATSKITHFDDLSTKLNTFGFRGEALASISHVSKVQILTRTKDSPCAYRANYLDGKILNAQPSAGNVGTTITVEDMFYNMPTRKQAFKNYNEEYQKILDVITKYSILYGDKKISFSCKKYGQNIPDIYTPENSTTVNNIKLSYGHAVAKELLDLSFSVDSSQFPAATNQENNIYFGVEGKITNANYSSTKKPVYIFFINNRLIENSSMKKVIEVIYQEILPKHAHPFVFLSIQIPPQNVDVNVHPSKKEVNFLYEEIFLEHLAKQIRLLLKGSNESRSFTFQSILLPENPLKYISGNNSNNDLKLGESRDMTTSEDLETAANNNSSKKRKAADEEQDDVFTPSEKQPMKTPLSQYNDPKKMIRIDPKSQKIHYFLQEKQHLASFVPAIGDDKNGSCQCCQQPPFVASNESSSTMAIDLVYCSFCQPVTTTENQTQSRSQSQPQFSSATNSSNNPQNPRKAMKLPELKLTSCGLHSIESLIKNLQNSYDSSFHSTLKECQWIGIINSDYSLLQYQTKLILFDVSYYLQQLFYQLTLFQFQEMQEIKFSTGFPLLAGIECGLAGENILLPLEDGEEENNKIDDEKDIKEDAMENKIKQIALKIYKLLLSKAPMLYDYFRINISEEGFLIGLPDLLVGYQPDSTFIPSFLVKLALETNWKEETACFHSIAMILSELYANIPFSEETNDEAGEENNDKQEKLQRSTSQQAKQKGSNLLMEVKLFPALKSYFLPQKKTTNSSFSSVTSGFPQQSMNFMEIASLENLYKIFERC